jgi:putative tryptophan/tyrosine transport system substrate-binding protein
VIPRLAIGLSLALLTLHTPAGAQPAERIGRVAFLSAGAVSPALLREFQDELRGLGWVEGRNVLFEIRAAEGRYERLLPLTEELLKWQPHVICAAQTPATEAAMKATATIPIVMVGNGDPVRYGLVRSLTRPEGNVTGTAFLPNETGLKLLEILKEAVPRTIRLAVFGNPANPGHASFVEDFQAAAPRLGLALRIVRVSTDSELDRALEALNRERVDALYFSPDGFLMANRRKLLDFAHANRLPAVGGNPIYAEAGALMTYSPQIPALLRQAARQVNKLLRGARPGDLPVELPSRFELIVNAKTARALDLSVPPSILVRAERVIE